ncbi:hypothetical protein ES703_53498 [subsurface metagenome]
MAPVTCIASAVGDCFQSFVFTDHQPKCVADLFSIVENSLLVHLFDYILASHASLIKIINPFDQVVRRRKQAGCPDIGIIQPSFPEAVIPQRRIGIGSVLDYSFMVVIELRIRHAERLKDILLGPFPE